MRSLFPRFMNYSWYYRLLQRKAHVWSLEISLGTSWLILEENGKGAPRRSSMSPKVEYGAYCERGINLVSVNKI